MKTPKKSAGLGMRRPAARRGRSAVRPKGQRWFFVIAAGVGVAIVGFAVSMPFWAADEASEESQDDAQRQIASRPHTEDEPTATSTLLSDDWTTPMPDPSEVLQEPIPVPPEPASPSPRPSASPPRPWGPIPETAEDFKNEALEAVHRLLEDYPRNPDSPGAMGITLYRYGDIHEATEWLSKCLDEDPKRADACQLLGVIALETNEFEEAERLLRRAAEIDPNLSGIYEDQAKVFLEIGKPQQAAATLQKAIEISPGRHQQHLLLAQAQAQLNEHEKAVENYQEAAELKPLDPAAYYGLANAHARLRQRDKAAQAMEKFKQLRAEEDQSVRQHRRRVAEEMRNGLTLLALTHTDVAHAYFGAGNLPKAVSHLQRAADVDPKATSCRQQLFHLYVHNERWDDALKVSRQLKQIDPNNAVYHLNTGRLLAHLKQFDAAEEVLGKAIELDPNDPLGHRFLARLLLLQNDKLEEAKATAQGLVEVERTPENYVLLGEACDKAGDSAGAIAAVEAAVQLDPDNGRYKQLRDQLQGKQ